MRGAQEGLVASALRDWLLLQLPAKVAQVNAARPAVLLAPWAGPYTIPAGKTLGLTTATGNVFTGVNLTSGVRSATQLAADINTALAATVASEDSVGRLVLTSPLAPVVNVPSLVKLRGGTNTDANSIFGWGLGGQLVMTTALVAPSYANVCDGLPLLPDFVNANGPGPIVIVIEDRISDPTGAGAPRNDQYLVKLGLTVMRTEPAQQVHRNREHIQASVQCVREVLSTDAGRQLGRAGPADISLVMFGTAKVSAQPFGVVDNKKLISPLYDFATMQLNVRVYERPAAT